MSKGKHSKPRNRAGGKSAPVVFPQTEERYTVAVVGGGASGIAAACLIAQYAHACNLDMRVVLLEKTRRIGSSILRSGNGRCNFSHADIKPSAYWNSEAVGQVFDSLEAAWDQFAKVVCRDSGLDSLIASYTSQVHANAVLRWFAHLGLVWSEADGSGGLLYPYSNKASSVLEVLQNVLDRYGVECYCSLEVGALSQSDSPHERFELELSDVTILPNSSLTTESMAQTFQADRIILAGGGKSVPSLQNTELFAGLDVVVPAPVLGPLKTDIRLLEGLDGMRASVRLSCPARSFTEEGEILFRTYGVSGIVVFNASRFVEPGDVLKIDLVPSWATEELESVLLQRLSLLSSGRKGRVSYAELLKGFLLPELSRVVLRSCSLAESKTKCAHLNEAIDVDSAANEEGIACLVRALKSFDLLVVGLGDPQQCQVMRGGVSLDSVNLETMEARLHPGAFFTGEILDVDGPCGGYNLHWAWASGMLAALSIVDELRDRSDTLFAAKSNVKGGRA